MDIITYPCWALTHRGRVTHICVSKVTRSVPSHYLNQCWNIVNWTLRNKLKWNLNRNSYISIQENAFKIVWKMAIILSRPQCVMLIHACKTGPRRQCQEAWNQRAGYWHIFLKWYIIIIIGTTQISSWNIKVWAGQKSTYMTKICVAIKHTLWCNVCDILF